MKVNKTNEMLEQYSAPKCKVVKTSVNRAIMALSAENESFTEENVENW